ncbi:hypothetical protein D3C84_1016520 [compost metagenome]
MKDLSSVSNLAAATLIQGVMGFRTPCVFFSTEPSSHICTQAYLNYVLQTIDPTKIFSAQARQAVYHCARQPRRGLWNTTMDLPSSYSIASFANQELTD